MQRVPLQKRIVFLLFQPIRRARTFLIACAHVARDRLAQSFRFCAFERDDFLRHRQLFLIRIGRGSGFFFLAFAAFFIGQTEKRRD